MSTLFGRHTLMGGFELGYNKIAKDQLIWKLQEVEVINEDIKRNIDKPLGALV